MSSKKTESNTGTPRSASAAEPASKPVRIVLVDDHLFVRDMVTIMLSRDRRFQVVAEAGTMPEAMAACDRLSPHLIVLDVDLPGGNGIDAVPELKRRFPSLRILICSESVSEEQIVLALRVGPHGFIEKPERWHSFIDALERVARGENYYCPRSMRILAAMATAPSRKSSHASHGLTGREIDVLRLIASGKTGKEIATQLHVSITTVDSHRAKLMRKIGARNAVELTHHAFRQGLISVTVNHAGGVSAQAPPSVPPVNECIQGA